MNQLENALSKHFSLLLSTLAANRELLFRYDLHKEVSGDLLNRAFEEVKHRNCGKEDKRVVFIGLRALGVLSLEVPDVVGSPVATD